jgi:hypothetical protein
VAVKVELPPAQIWAGDAFADIVAEVTSIVISAVPVQPLASVPVTV